MSAQAIRRCGTEQDYRRTNYQVLQIIEQRGPIGSRTHRLHGPVALSLTSVQDGSHPIDECV